MLDELADLGPELSFAGTGQWNGGGRPLVRNNCCISPWHGAGGTNPGCSSDTDGSRNWWLAAPKLGDWSKGELPMLGRRSCRGTVPG